MNDLICVDIDKNEEKNLQLVWMDDFVEYICLYFLLLNKHSHFKKMVHLSGKSVYDGKFKMKFSPNKDSN